MTTVRYLSLSANGVTKHFPIFKRRGEDEKEITGVYLIKEERNTRKFEGLLQDEEPSQ